MPDVQGRQLGQGSHAQTICRDGSGRRGAGSLVGKIGGQSGHCDACSQSLEVDREVDAGQRLVEVIDVEKNVFLRGCEGSEVHQLTVAASLNRNARARLTFEVLCHYGGGAAEEGKWACKHSRIANRYQLRDAVAVGRSED